MMWVIRLANGIETRDLPQPDRATAEQTARLCRLAAPTVSVAVIAVPKANLSGGPA